MVAAQSLREWLLWLAAHYDPGETTPENSELRRLGGVLEELGRQAGAIDLDRSLQGTPACLLSSFDWEHGKIEFAQPHLLTNRLGSADPEPLIARLETVTGIAEHLPAPPPDPDYMV